MNDFAFLTQRSQQQQARLAHLLHRQAMTRLQAALCLDRQCPRSHLQQLRARRKHLEFLRRQAAQVWPFSMN